MRILHTALLLWTGSLTLVAQTGCIEGKVFDTAGAPIPGIHVIGTSAAQRTSFAISTDSEGYFRIDTVPAGDYELATSDEPRADPGKTNIADEKEFARVPATVVKEGCSTVTLPGRIRARLHLVAKDLLTAQAIRSANARFRYNESTVWGGIQEEQDLLVPPFTELEVQGGAKGYENSAIIHIHSLQPGERRELEIVLRPIQLGCIAGQVVDQRGSPVSGVRVQPNLASDHLRRQPGVRSTDKNGRFRFEAVQPGNYTIFTFAEPVGYSTIAEHENDASLVVEASSGCADITINLGYKAAKIRLKVVDGLTHEVVNAFTASVTGGYINGHGNWGLKVFQNPVPVPALKPLEVFAVADGYRASERIALGLLQPEEETQITIELYPLASGAAKAQH